MLGAKGVGQRQGGAVVAAAAERGDQRPGLHVEPRAGQARRIAREIGAHRERARPVAAEHEQVVQAEVVGEAVVAIAPGGVGDRDPAVALGQRQALVRIGQRDLEIAVRADRGAAQPAERPVDLGSKRSLVGRRSHIDLERQQRRRRCPIDHRDRGEAAARRAGERREIGARPGQLRRRRPGGAVVVRRIQDKAHIVRELLDLIVQLRQERGRGPRAGPAAGRRAAGW